MRRINLITIALLGASVYASAQDVNKLIKQEDVSKTIGILAADDMQGRATFSPGIEKAAKFIEGEFKQAGLQPLAGAADYRQNFTMTRVAPINAQATINGTAILSDKLVVSSNAPFTWNTDTGVVVKHIDATQNLYGEYIATRRSGKKTLIIIDPAQEPTFRQLQAAIGKGSVSMKKVAGSSQQMAFILGTFPEVKTFTVSMEVKNEQLPLFNIAGMLKGKTKPDEYVVFSGHFDHLGIIKPMEGDSIANGADDDASGTTAVITLAKYFSKLKSNGRSIIFVAFTAEEIGEYGSAYFATQVDPAKVSAMFNIEMIGKTSKFGENSAFITGYERSDFGPILQKNLEGTAFKFYPDPYTKENLFYRSDNASLARVGVPAHTISTDQIDIDKLYHSVKDEVSSLDMANITATIRAIALSSKTIIAGTDTPTRIPPASVNQR